ncbi:hypothetical protein RE428_26450 [Marinobacter nanhaiticus D15-8W]|nr:hypothetical protein [Marinobacter nanhaiticus]BES71627.1 hypothetical protein RE428_26450 [Marinobacter nanhaiticus D15-8W]
MRVIPKLFLIRLFLLLMLSICSSQVFSQQPKSELSEAEIKQFAQEQFAKMYKRAMENASLRLADGEAVKAFAVVADRGGEIRLIRIDKIEQMPPNVALEVMRRSLRVLVGKGNVGATCLVYVAGNPNKEARAEYVLVAEMEHIFGPTLAQLTPYTVQEGKTVFGEPVTVESEPSIFNFRNKDGERSEAPAE